jgi:hypothetical protein
MSLQINTRHIRRSPGGEETIVNIKTQQEADYHHDLIKEGYTYTPVTPAKVVGGTCTSCEG